MWLMGMRVRPSSTVSWTGMSRIMLMSFVAAFAPADEKSVNATGAAGGEPTSEATSGLASARAAAHSAAMSSSAELVVSDILVSEPAHVRAGQHAIDLQRVLAVGSPVMAFENGHPDHLRLDAGAEVELDEVTGLEGEQLLHGGRRVRQFGHHLHLGGLDLLLHQVDPAAVRLVAVALDRGVQDVADGFQRRVRNAEVDGAGGGADLEREARGQDAVAWRRRGR